MSILSDHSIIMEILVDNEMITLRHEKAILLPKHNALLIADLHFGKVNHFRKSGVAVPIMANEQNNRLLIELLNSTKPERVIFLGDLFHSHYNDEWETLGQIRRHFSSCSFELVMGNHDILHEQQYQRNGLVVFKQQLIIGQWLLTHEPLKTIPEGNYNLSGHIHPGVRLHGTAKQSITLPCFFFGDRHGILPAFGSFTGLALIQPKQKERVFVISEEKIIAFGVN
jgi:DNA ligase-associated metallophosphoesterase